MFNNAGPAASTAYPEPDCNVSTRPPLYKNIEGFYLEDGSEWRKNSKRIRGHPLSETLLVKTPNKGECKPWIKAKYVSNQ